MITGYFEQMFSDEAPDTPFPKNFKSIKATWLRKFGFIAFRAVESRPQKFSIWK